MKINVKKAFVNSTMVLLPCDEEAKGKMTKLSQDKIYNVDVKHDRNYRFHRKFFALLNYAFDIWKDKPAWSKQDQVLFSFDAFRKNITILAGYHNAVFTLEGSIELEAKSISFAKMGQETFDKLYSDVIDVILQKVLVNYKRDDLENVVNNILGFA